MIRTRAGFFELLLDIVLAQPSARHQGAVRLSRRYRHVGINNRSTLFHDSQVRRRKIVCNADASRQSCVETKAPVTLDMGSPGIGEHSIRCWRSSIPAELSGFPPQFLTDLVPTRRSDTNSRMS